MIIYPVAIPTLNRYEHFRRCVESLAINTYANQTELVIGLDYPPSEKYMEGYVAIKNYIPTIKGFAKVTVLEHDHNLGVAGNGTSISDYCYSHYDAMIYSEDDNEFAPCFLDYMNKVLNRYKHDSKVVSVSGYCHYDFKYNGDLTAFFSYESNGWGLGLWREKETSLKSVFFDKTYFERVLHNIPRSMRLMQECPSVFSMLPGVLHLPGCDVERGAYNFMEHTYQVRPTKTLVRNWGYDGSGVNCGTTENQNVANQELPTDNTYNLSDTILSAASADCERFYRNMNVPKGFFSRWRYKLAVLHNYINYLRKN